MSSLIIYLCFLILLCLFVATRTILSVLKKFAGNLIEEDQFKEAIVLNNELWKKPGFSELNYFIELCLDTATVILGYLFFQEIFNSMGFSGSLLIFSALGTTTFIHILFAQILAPTLSQIWMEKLIHPMVYGYQVVWPLFGWIGKIIFNLSEKMMSHVEFYRKYKLIRETDIINIDAVESGLDEDEAEMVQNIVNIGNTTVKEVFTPRIDIVALSITSTYEEVLQTLRSSRYTRIPIYQDTIDEILGILHAKDILLQENLGSHDVFNLEKVMRPAYFIPTSKKIDDLMSEFKVNHTHMAIVVDEYGGTAGLITLEDVLEEIVGDIQDEDDTEAPMVTQVGEHSFVIDPVITLDELSRDFDLHFIPSKEVEIDTLGGYLQYIKGSVPSEGELIESDGFKFEILKMNGQAIEKIRLNRLAIQ